MFRKLALAGAIVCALAIVAASQEPAPPTVKVHTHLNSVGQEEESLGTVCIDNTTGNPVSCGGGGGGGDATAANQVTTNTEIGATNEGAAATDTSTSGLNGLIKRANQRLTSLITALTNTIVLQAGENHVGETGNNQITITVAQTVTASSAYAAGNAVGGLITFANAARVSGAAGAAGTSGLVQSAVVNSKSSQSTQMDLVLFSANPTGSTCTDKTLISVAVADFDKVLGVAHITDWTNLATPSVGQAQNLAMPYALVSSTTIYGCLVTRSTPTFTATTDISVSLRGIRN